MKNRTKVILSLAVSALLSALVTGGIVYLLHIPEPFNILLGIVIALPTGVLTAAWACLRWNPCQ